MCHKRLMLCTTPQRWCQFLLPFIPFFAYTSSASGDKLRIVNTTIAVGNRTMSAQCEVGNQLLSFSYDFLAVNDSSTSNLDMERHATSSGGHRHSHQNAPITP